LEAFVWDPRAAGAALTRVESPFVNAYSEESLFEGVNTDAETVQSVLGELYDGEFDEALYELAHEAASVGARALTPYGSATDASARLLEAWIEPLRAESELLFDNLAGALARKPAAALGDDEIEQLIDEVAKPSRPLEPPFDQFFKKLVKKATSVVKSVAAVAKKGIALAQKLSPIHLLLGRLKKYVRPLVAKVVRMALNKLPTAVRPAAAQLAKRLTGAVGLEAETTPEAEASADVGMIQRELDEAVVQLMFAGESGSAELMLFEASEESESASAFANEPVAATQLDAARAQFVSEISGVTSERAGPVVEQFIPAILPALRLGIRLIGRPRVVSTLARLVGQLIGRFVGPQATPALSRAIVDTGMKLLTLEAPEQEQHAGPHAIASTVEDVVRRVSEASEEALDDTRLLEAEVAEAFNRAAAAHFPQQMLSQDKRESTTAGGTWVLFPKGGFKKYTRVFDVELTPDLARASKTFGGTTLEAFLRDRLRVEFPVRARVHLYEAIPGTWISRIARAEKGVAGLSGKRGTWQLFHPLTTQAAAALLREPGLGRDVSGKFNSTSRQLAVGQRVFYLEIPGVAAGILPRAGGVNLVADFPKNELRVSLFLAERQAQQLVQRLNAGASAGSVLGGLKELVSSGVRNALSQDVRGRVRIIHEAVDSEGFLGGALKRVPSVLLEQFGGKVSDWTTKAIADHLQQQATTFASAVQNPADGVTVQIALGSPPGFSALRATLRGKGTLPLSNLAAVFKGAPTASVKVVPGFAA
jgi:hypothetical protein